jgi:hypothetical protein
MDDDGSALRVGANYKSLTDLECALKHSSRITTSNFISVSQGSLVRGPNIKTWKLQKVQRVF